MDCASHVRKHRCISFCLDIYVSHMYVQRYSDRFLSALQHGDITTRCGKPSVKCRPAQIHARRWRRRHQATTIAFSVGFFVAALPYLFNAILPSTLPVPPPCSPLYSPSSPSAAFPPRLANYMAPAGVLHESLDGVSND
jgi:hypothetical protein